MEGAGMAAGRWGGRCSETCIPQPPALMSYQIDKKII